VSHLGKQEDSDTLLANGAGDYRLDVVISPTCTLSSNTLNISELNCNRLTGDLRYDNNNLTPLAGIPVHLKTLIGNTVMSDTTDSSGSYSMVGYANGNYLLDVSINYQPGGVNSTDAVLVSRSFSGVITLSALRAAAGDVNGNGVTNSLDALTISRRATNIITSFSAGNFVHSRPSFTASGNPVVVNVRSLSTGDVNGSFSNISPSAPVLVLDSVYSTFPTATAQVRFTTQGSGVFERGICWDTSPNPTIADNKSIAGAGSFGFTHSFGGLALGVTYYVRAYARNSSGTVYSNERTIVIPLAIGMTHAGGIVFYIDGTGQHGLVCAPFDQGYYIWGCRGTNISTSTVLGGGQLNTSLILSGCGQRPIAASVCADLVLNGYNDWFLPSIDELSMMYSNLKTQGIGGFSNEWYWSSSQDGANLAWFMRFTDGLAGHSYKSEYYWQVRAVRAF
jgi:hypothetical protein